MYGVIPGEIKKPAIILIHACTWVLYGSFLYLANYLTRPDIPVMNIVLFLVPHILTFYVSLYCLGLYSKIGIRWSIAAFFTGFIVMTAIGYSFVYMLLPSMGVVLYSTESYGEFFKAALLGYVQYFSYAVLYFYADRTIKKQRELRQKDRELSIVREEKLQKELENAKLAEKELTAQKDKLTIEYAFLRAQVNPHFLYNTLNILYNQALEHSDELAMTISKISRIMRYSMEGAKHENDLVSLRKELDNMELLIEINNLRFNGNLALDYKVEGEVDEYMLPPLSIITAIENAFKYGDVEDPQCPLTIRVICESEQLYFYCSNRKMDSGIEVSSNNIGISNLSKRLDVAFKDRYKMEAKEDNDLYIFELTIYN